MNEILIFVLILISIISGFLISIFLSKIRYKKQSVKIIKDAKRAGEQFKKDKLLQAKEKFIELKAAHDRFIQEKNKDLELRASKVSRSEQALNSKLEDCHIKKKELEVTKMNLDKRLFALDRKEQELDESQIKQISLLENISGFTKKQAKEELLSS